MSRHKDAVGPKAILRRIGVALISARARAIMSIGIVLGLGAVGTLAAWSDTAIATSGVFTTGRIDIKLGADPGVDNNPAAFSTALTNTAIVPGNVVTAPLLVRNSGTVAFNYTLSVVASNTGIGNLLNSSVFETACGPTALSSVTGLGTSKPFAGFPRTIAVGATDQLCISVTMPAGTTVPALGATGTVTYTLVATSS